MKSVMPKALETRERAKQNDVSRPRIAFRIEPLAAVAILNRFEPETKRP